MKKSYLPFFVVFLLFSCSLITKAQTGTLKGKVVDFYAKKGVPDFNIQYYTTDDKKVVNYVQTASDGTFELSLAPASYTLITKQRNYDRQRFDDIVIKADSITIIDITVSLAEKTAFEDMEKAEEALPAIPAIPTSPKGKSKKDKKEASADDVMYDAYDKSEKKAKAEKSADMDYAKSSKKEKKSADWSIAPPRSSTSKKSKKKAAKPVPAPAPPPPAPKPVDEIGTYNNFKKAETRDYKTASDKKSKKKSADWSATEYSKYEKAKKNYATTSDKKSKKEMADWSPKKNTFDGAEMAKEIKKEREMLKAGSLAITPASINQAKAGILTAGEINDFSKWKLWGDITDNQLKEWREHWRIYPQKRYMVQVVNKKNTPVVDADVSLKDQNGRVIWQAKTDNTGKAELWADLFTTNTAQKKETQGNLSLEINHGGKKVKEKKVTAFHNGINKIQIDADCNSAKQMDVLFVVDATSSMDDEIQYLKAELVDVMAKAEAAQEEVSINWGSMFYRDEFDDYLTRKSDFSTDAKKTIEFVNKQYGRGGGDMPEAVHTALERALNSLSWSENAVSRLLFLILDAPPHHNPTVLKSLQNSMIQAAEMGVRIIPITCSGIQKDTEYLMRSMALATNGTYVFLTDDSGVGDSHIKPTTDEFKVELLNDVFVRLIDQYAFLPGCDLANLKDEIADLPIIKNEKDSKKQHTQNQNNPNNPKLSVHRFLCYPNPAEQYVNVDVNKQVKELFLTDANGKILQRWTNIPSGRKELDLGAYPSAIYFLRYQFDGVERWGVEQLVLLR